MKAYKQKETKYYKYEYSDFVQPTLSANVSDTFSVFGTQKTNGTQSLWMAFDGSLDTVWCPVAVANPANSYCVFHNSEPLKVSTITITNRKISNYHVTGYQVLASNNNSDWDLLTTDTNSVGDSGATWQINVNSQQYYNYYKFLITSGKYDSQYSCSIAQISIQAEEQVAVESTEEEYDYLVENNVYCLPKNNDKYYGITG